MALNPRQKLLKQQSFKQKTTAQRILEAEQKRKGITPVIDQAPTIDPNAPKSGERQKGVFTSSSGQTVNRAGKPINPDGSPVVPETPEQPLATYADIGEANLQADYDANIATELELTGESKGYTSFEEYAKDLFASQKEQSGLSREQLALQEQQMVESTTDQKNALTGQVEGATPLVGTREGVTSMSNLSTYDRLKQVTDQRRGRLQASHDMALKQIDQARADLDRAERSGNTQLAEQYRQTLLSAESQAQQTEADLANALSQQLSTESNYQQVQQAIKESSIASFQALVDEGQELSVETISGFAKSLGIDFDTAYGYYAGTQAIRDDKSLSLEEKQVALDQAKQDLNDQITGMDTQFAQAVKGLQTLRARGATEEEISAYKSAAGITDYDDPLTQAELAYNQAKSKIAYNEANGIIVSPLDMIDLAQKTYDYYSQIGYTAGAVPTGGEYGASYYTQENGLPAIMVNVQNGQALDLSDTSRDEGQCGAFVNDFFGEKMMGDLFTQKMGLVDKSIQVPEPGMAFVMETESPYGHTGIVEYVDPSRGVMGIVDANWSNDGKIQRREIPITDASGFVKAPNSENLSGGKNYNDAQKSLMDNLDPSDLSSTDLELLDNSGLSSNDLFTYLAQDKRALPENKKTEIQQVYDALLDLKDAKGKSGAVGLGWQSIPGLYGEGEAPSGTDAAGFIAKFNTFRDNLAIPNLENMKGALSDKDIQFLRNTATALSLTMNEETFDETLAQLEAKYKSLLTQGTDSSIDEEKAQDPLGLGVTSSQYDPLGLLD